MSKRNGFKHKQLDIRIKIGISLMVGLFVFLITFYQRFRTASTMFSDWVYQSESVNALPVSIIRIDEETLNAMGQHTTWSRQVYADILNALNRSEDVRPAAIVFDILFTGPYDEAGDKAFAEAAAKYDNVITGIKSDYHPTGKDIGYNTIYFPYEELKESTTMGLVNCNSGTYDYVTTFINGIYDQENSTWYDCLAIAALKKFDEFVKSHKEFAALHPEYTDIEIPKELERHRSDIDYRFSYSTAPGDLDAISLVDLLDSYNKYLADKADPNVTELHDPADRYANSIVFVGAYAEGLQDSFRILFSNQSQMYGVEIHANILEAIFEGNIQVEANSTILAVIYALFVAGICFLMLGLDIIKGTLIGVSSLLLHFIISILIYKNYRTDGVGIYIQLLHMTISPILLIIGMVVFHYLNARSERMKINNAFRMYVAPEIVDDVAGSGTYQLQLGGRHKDIAVLFVDIRGFTTMSENLAPEEVVDILNEYFGVITDAIFKNKGTLDKFIGDAAMAVFNSPFDLDDYVYRAVSTACDIAKASEALGEKLMERFGKKVSYGIGVNCGEAIIGNIGSNFRMDYTAIGDTVNTASRLESNAKAGEILISEEVRKRLEGRLVTEDVGEIPLKGKSKKIFVYRVLSLKDTDPASTESAESTEEK